MIAFHWMCRTPPAIPPLHRFAKGGFTGFQAFSAHFIEPDAGYGPPCNFGRARKRLLGLP
jgi:hypothetical protein